MSGLQASVLTVSLQKLINMNHLDRLERKIGYQFSDLKNLKLALTHRSASTQHNERLEFLGDSILNYVIADALYHQFPRCNEGELSRMRATLVREPTLAMIARNFELGDYMSLGSGELKSGGFRRESILADSFEAILGAVYIDSNLDEARVFALSHIKQYIDHIEENEDILDFKSILQEYVQKEFRTVPTYKLIAERGPDHMKEFEIQVIVGNYKEKAVARNKKKAEQLSAKALCIKLGVKYHEAL